MKNVNYRDIELVSLNVAGWNWRSSNERWGARFTRICEHIKDNMNNPLVIALQEVQLSGGKYLTVLEEQFPDYHIVLPKAYKNQLRSVVSVLLINKKLCESYNVRILEGLDDSLRYNFVHINTHIEGLCFRILNMHLPHNCLENAAEWYRADRETLRALFVESIKTLANTYKSEPDLKLVVLGDLNTLPDDKFMESLAYAYNSPMIDAVKYHDKETATWRNNATRTKSRLDYILYSTGMLYNTGLGIRHTMLDDTTILNDLSDHAIIVGGIVLDVA